MILVCTVALWALLYFPRAGDAPPNVDPVAHQAEALENSYAVILVEQDIPAENVTLDEVYVGLETDVRERQQRLMMETRARQLLTEYQPSVLDGSLRWSWDRRGELSPR